MLTTDDLLKAADAAGITTPEQMQLAFGLVKAFMDAGISDTETAAVFAQRSALQMKSVALQASLVTLSKKRDDAQATANAELAKVQAEINATNAAIQSTIPAV